jgi:hypothetical protein
MGLCHVPDHCGSRAAQGAKEALRDDTLVGVRVPVRSSVVGPVLVRRHRRLIVIRVALHTKWTTHTTA